MNAEQVARSLKRPRRIAGGWTACCPVHADERPSLTLHDKDGKLLVHCQAGCSQDAVLDALKARGLWAIPDPAPDYRKRMNGAHPKPETALVHKQFGKPHAVYEYYNASSKLAGVVCRWDWPAQPGHEKRKELRPALPEGNGWVWAAMPAPRPLYGLAAILAEPLKPVLIVEGEKTADAAWETIDGHLVVTWAGGAAAVAQTDWTPLKTRTAVTIWPDADPPGVKAAAEIAQILPQCKIVPVDGLPLNWDLADWRFGDADPMERMARAEGGAKLNSPKTEWSGASLSAAEFPEIRWAIPGLVPEGLTILASRAKAGKSWMSLDWAVAVSLGQNALGNIPCDQGDVLVLALEDPPRRLSQRIKAILQGRPGPSRAEFFPLGTWKRMDDGGLVAMRTWLIAHPAARLVIIDLWARFCPERERHADIYRDDYKALMPLKELADEFHVAIVLLHHENKSGQISGTTAMQGAPDTVLTLKRERTDHHGTMTIEGREVEGEDMALEFNNKTGQWTKIGPEADFRKSQERRAVIHLLLDSGPMTPADVAKSLGKKTVNTRVLMNKMLKAGELIRFADGTYKA